MIFENYKYFKLLLIITALISLNSLAQTDNKEFRATWVITWEHISSSKSVEQNKATIREILDNHVKANMTSVLFQIRQSGTAYYQSSFEPWGYYAGYTYPGYDPLQYAVEEAHKRGLELHAWFNVFNVSSTQPGTIAAEHPEWICRDQNGNPMTSYRCASPGLKAVRDYTINVAMEIVRNYDIDGLHLDYVRWNEYDTDDMINPNSQIEQESKLDGDFSEKTMNKLSSVQSTNRFLYDVEHPFSAGVPTGFSTWEDWWRWSVTEFVKALHDSIQNVKPWIRLSPAALGKYKYGGATGWNGYYVVYQDAALWFNQGYIEQLTPMHYHWLTGEELFNFISTDWEPNIQQGINSGRLYSCGPGSYRLDENNVWSNHVGIVERLRDKSWVDGFQFFSYGTWKGYNYWEEAASLFFNNKVKQRNVYSTPQPFSPTISILKIDSLNYDINVTPNTLQSENCWYVIYRSEDNILSVENDKIVNIHFGNHEYTFSDSYNGLQNFNQKYTYFATCSNRYWNESEISNFVVTDSIPSFAPTVVFTNPQDGEEIHITKDIVIEFSKSMNPSSFEGKVTFKPITAIADLIWTKENKSLEIRTQNFDYDTEYLLKIDSSVTDINGKMIDGDRDGIPGDPYVLSFRTFEQDNTGPIVILNFPENNAESVDIGSIITVEFDEEVDNQTLSTSSISVLEDGIPVNYNYLHTLTSDNRSVLSIQPVGLFSKEKTYSLIISNSITDSIGNSADEDWSSNFSTSDVDYKELKMIDNFTYPGDWQQPSYSGSTKGILESGTYFEYSSSVCLPSTSPKKSAKLSYLWDENASDFLIREYLKGGTPQSIYFDTSYVLQSYIYGDGSNSKFRFCIDEYQNSAWGDHEVSNWVNINWNGWKLVEWQLNDPSSIGIWIGDEKLTGAYFRIDSYQLTRTSESRLNGTIYFDDLRAVKKSSQITDIKFNNSNNPTDYSLFQNYPNPFNPNTKITWQSPVGGWQTIKLYDVLGQEIDKIVEGYFEAGIHSTLYIINSTLTSGVYYYQLRAGDFVSTKKMILLK